MNKNDEEVLVIKSDIIFKNGIWRGLKRDNLDYYIDLINKNCEFRKRSEVEENDSFQQIIPYMIFSFKNNFFIYKYIKNAAEKRLINNNYQVGIAGHINQTDNKGNKKNNIVEAGMMREWEEEVTFKGNLIDKKFIGIINDNSKPVEKVHLGLLYHFIGDSPFIELKEKDKMEGKLVELKDLSKKNINHSVWMNIVYNEYLSKLNS